MPEQRTERITVVVTPAEYEYIRVQAFRARKTLSTFVRDQLLESIGYSSTNSFVDSDGRDVVQNGRVVIES